jgi:hypothetical protein
MTARRTLPKGLQLRDGATHLAVGRRLQYSLGPEPFGGTVHGPWNL